MRIAHCILEPRYSGAEMLVLNLVRAQIAAGIPTALFAMRPSEPAFQVEIEALAGLGCEIYVPLRHLVRQHRVVWIWRAARSFRPDVIFAHSLLPSIYSRLAMVGVSGVAVASVLHTDNDFANANARRFERWMWRANAVVVGVSAASLRNYRKLITTKKQTRLIANGVHLETVRAASAQRDEVRERVFQAKPDDIILLQVGRISPQKRQHFSVEALASLVKHATLRSARLIFVGIVEFPEYYREVVSAARVLGVEERIQFMGSRKDVPLLLAGADAHLMPSGWEAHSIAAIEAVASGIFCVFTPIESFLPFDGMAGVTILPPEASASQLAETLATAIRTSALTLRYERELTHLGFEHCAREYMRLAQELVDGVKAL